MPEDRQQDDIGELLNCPHWQWLPGMAVVYTFGSTAKDRYLREDKDGVHLVVEDLWRSESGPLTWIRKRPESFKRDCAPDLTDDATLGRLLGLVRKAWRNAPISISIGLDGTCTIRIVSMELEESCCKIRPTYAEALVAVLLAAPKIPTEGETI